MAKRVKIVLAVLAIVLVGIQLVRPKKNQGNNQEQHIAKKYAVPAHVEQILKEACNDCHSNYTIYPWYNNIQPVGFWLAHHVDEGKAELNLSEFLSYRPYKQYHKLEETVEMVNEGEMPLNSYTWTHAGARLTQQQKTALVGWAQGIMAEMKAHYPADSLVRPPRPGK